MAASTATTERSAGGPGSHGADDLSSGGPVAPAPGGPAPEADGAAPSPDPTGAVLAVDIGGTKMEVGVVDATGRILDRLRTATPSTPDPEAVFDALRRTVTEVLDRSTVTPASCGVGCGGPMESGGVTVSPLNIHAWRGFPLAGRLADLVGMPVWRGQRRQGTRPR